MVDRRIVPNLRWIAERFPIYVTDGYSGPLPKRRARRLQRLPHPQLRPLQRPRRRHRPAAAASTNCDRSWNGDHRGSPSGPSRARTSPARPSAGSATTATPATAAATTCTSPGTTRRRAEFQLAEWVEVLPAGQLD